MKSTIFIILLLITGITFVYSQHRLESGNNMFRAGDEIVKQQVSYKDPGRPGENVLWDFSNLDTQNEGYTLSYQSFGEPLILGIEHQTMYKYTFANDSLLGWGFENPTTLMWNQQPELLMKFPVRYGDKTSSYYSGNGKYCDRLKLGAMGTVETHADAFGMMILPSKDTLRNVIRVHTVKRIAEETKPLSSSPPTEGLSLSLGGRGLERGQVSPDSINYRLENDSILMAVETYRWYVKGYRYPVFETVKSITDKHGEERKFFDTAFFYPPQEHYYLEGDEANLADLEESALSPGGSGESGTWNGLTYNFHPNPVQTNLEVEIYMPKEGHVRMQLTDRLGRLLWQHDYGVWQTGINNLQIPMFSYPKGEYVLNMWFDEYMVGEKILKY